MLESITFNFKKRFALAQLFGVLRMPMAWCGPSTLTTPQAAHIIMTRTQVLFFLSLISGKIFSGWHGCKWPH